MEGVAAGSPHVVEVVLADEGLEFGGHVRREFVVLEVEDSGQRLVTDGALVGGVGGRPGEVVVGGVVEEEAVEAETGGQGLLEEVEKAEDEEEEVGEAREGVEGGEVAGVGEAGVEVVVLMRRHSRAVW